jgi:hypothetical protein
MTLLWQNWNCEVGAHMTDLILAGIAARSFPAVMSKTDRFF